MRKKLGFLAVVLLGCVLFYSSVPADAYLIQIGGRHQVGGTGELWGESKDFADNGYFYRNEIFWEKQPDILLEIKDSFLWHDEEEQLSVENIRVSGKGDVEFFWNPPAWYLMTQNISDYYADGQWVDRDYVRPRHDVLPDENWHVDFR